MSDADDYFTDTARGWLKETGGDTATYVDPDTDAETTLTALLGPEEVEENPTDDGRTYRHSRVVTFFHDDLATFSKRGQVKIDGVTWQIEAIVGRSAVQTTVRLVRIGTAEVSRPAYRRQ